MSRRRVRILPPPSGEVIGGAAALALVVGCLAAGWNAAALAVLFPYLLLASREGGSAPPRQGAWMLAAAAYGLVSGASFGDGRLVLAGVAGAAALVCLVLGPIVGRVTGRGGVIR